MNEYIESLEREFSSIENGFKEEEKRAFTDYKSNDSEFIKKLAFLSYQSEVYQVRMYSVFLFGYLSEDKNILMFLRDDPSEYVRKSVGNALRDISKKYPELIRVELSTWSLETKGIKQVYQLANKLLIKS